MSWIEVANVVRIDTARLWYVLKLDSSGSASVRGAFEPVAVPSFSAAALALTPALPRGLPMSLDGLDVLVNADAIGFASVWTGPHGVKERILFVFEGENVRGEQAAEHRVFDPPAGCGTVECVARIKAMYRRRPGDPPVAVASPKFRPLNSSESDAVDPPELARDVEPLPVPARSELAELLQLVRGLQTRVSSLEDIVRRDDADRQFETDADVTRWGDVHGQGDR